MLKIIIIVLIKRCEPRSNKTVPLDKQKWFGAIWCAQKLYKIILPMEISAIAPRGARLKIMHVGAKHNVYK